MMFIRTRVTLFDFGGRYLTNVLEIWMEFMHGFYSTHQYAKYHSRRQYENFFQLGAEYILDHRFSVLCNSEFIRVNDNTWDWYKKRNNNYKLEIGSKYKTTSSSFLTVGALGELKHSWIGHQKVKKNHALQLATKFSFWF